jgi:hypothetical protein
MKYGEIFRRLLQHFLEVLILKLEVDMTCVTHGSKRNVYSDLVGKPEGKIPLGIPVERPVEVNSKLKIFIK